MGTFWSVAAAKNVDLPTLGLPTTPASIMPSKDAADARNTLRWKVIELLSAHRGGRPLPALGPRYRGHISGDRCVPLRVVRICQGFRPRHVYLGGAGLNVEGAHRERRRTCSGAGRRRVERPSRAPHAARLARL